jgi:hypothetical protein
MSWLGHLFSRRRRYYELSESIREHYLYHDHVCCRNSRSACMLFTFAPGSSGRPHAGPAIRIGASANSISRRLRHVNWPRSQKRL